MKNILSILIVVMFLISGCALLAGDGKIELEFEKGTIQEMLLEQSFDTLGYAIGLHAAKDEEFKKDIEGYYSKFTEINGKDDITILNEMLSKLRSKDIAQQIIAYKVVMVLKIIGGEVNEVGMIKSVGNLTEKHIEVIKNAYLIAIENSKERPNG